MFKLVSWLIVFVAITCEFKVCPEPRYYFRPRPERYDFRKEPYFYSWVTVPPYIYPPKMPKIVNKEETHLHGYRDARDAARVSGKYKAYYLMSYYGARTEPFFDKIGFRRWRALRYFHPTPSTTPEYVYYLDSTVPTNSPTLPPTTNRYEMHPDYEDPPKISILTLLYSKNDKK